MALPEDELIGQFEKLSLVHLFSVFLLETFGGQLGDQVVDVVLHVHYLVLLFRVL